MAKAGDEYQEIVGAVVRALDPGAIVNVGQWIEGPDGERDLDVEVRGTINRLPCFTLIECKDWNKPVGISVVDALDSKRRDLKADKAIIYSNSGFTTPALRKAARVEISTTSALKEGDGRIKVVVEKELIAKRLSVDSLTAKLYFPPGLPQALDDRWQIHELMFDNLPVINWISELSKKLIVEHEDVKNVVFKCAFFQSSSWSYHDRLLTITGLELIFTFSKKWLTQTVRVDTSLGNYDHLTEHVVIPNNEIYYLGAINREAWIETSMDQEKTELKPGTFEIRITKLNPIRANPGLGTPKISDLISEQEVRLL